MKREWYVLDAPMYRQEWKQINGRTHQVRFYDPNLVACEFQGKVKFWSRSKAKYLNCQIIRNRVYREEVV